MELNWEDLQWIHTKLALIEAKKRKPLQIEMVTDFSFETQEVEEKESLMLMGELRPVVDVDVDVDVDE